MKKKWRGLIALLLVAVLLIPVVGCVGEPAGNGEPAPDTTITGRLATLEGRMDVLDVKVDGIVITDTSGLRTDITALQEDVAALTTSVAALSTRLDALETGTPGSPNYTGEDTRWRFKVCFVTSDVGDYANVTVDTYDYSPRHIEEPGFYDFELAMTNTINTSITLTRASVELWLVPDDYVLVDEANTYLDSDGTLGSTRTWLDWDKEFVTREREGRDVCRRIVFVSDKFDIVISGSGEVTSEMVLELYYA